MKRRTKLCDRKLPNYCKGEEIMNMVTHIVGGGFAVLALILCILKCIGNGNTLATPGSAIYGISMVTLYTMSSVYHGLRPGTAKKVMQVIDHCTIYFLIAGTYTPILLTAMRPVYPSISLGLLIFEWCGAAVAATLTAIDLKKYNIFSMICYITTGWAILPFWRQAMDALQKTGFLLVLYGGIAYTIGAVLYGIGAKKPWIHSVFHIFVVIGSLLQFFAILLYVL